jgi:tRNA threonylcarbamoyladenosine biosynthesis protein TsaE
VVPFRLVTNELRAGVVTRTPEEMRARGRDLARILPPDTVLALHGDLGVGKTTLVQGLAEGLGVTEPVTSPTFNLFTLYEGRDRRLVHLDAYRLEDAAALDALMLEDFLLTPWLLAVEWPERIAAWLPATAWHLELGIAADESHTLRLR